MVDVLGPLFDEEPQPAVARAAVLTPPAIKAARAQLNPVRAPQSVWPLIGAAVLCAGSAAALVLAVILGPPNFGPDITISKPIPELRAPVR
ncbi:MAG: hypothetical protein B7Y99_10490 [Caulobacterales bacterium 32-69-10]|nr:MAG: hypothetical protein B7Y99_10490 [Caulobacterales bacterium 32-69-10]